MIGFKATIFVSMIDHTRQIELNAINMTRNFTRSILTGIVIGIGLAAVFTAGFVARDYIGGVGGAASAQSAEDYPLLREVQGLLDRHFLRDQPSYEQRQYGAIRGMLSTLDDRFTFFIDPPVAASESDALAGTYGGIGVQVTRRENGDVLLFPFDDSPAQLAGINEGAVLLAVNGTPLAADLNQDNIDQLLRGEVRAGNGVEVTITQVNGDTASLFIEFDVINVPSVVWRVLDDQPFVVGYLQVLSFTGRTPDELTTALTELRAQNVAGVILDLRDNRGGLLTESITVADEFVDDGVLVYEVKVDGERAFEGQAGGLMIDLPIVVLVNQNTASGAELVAGVIRDAERGILIGQTTYGKGTVQQIFPLSDRSSLHVTSAEWLTTARTPLERVGLTPDIAMIPDPDGRDVELAEALRYFERQFESQ